MNTPPVATTDLSPQVKRFAVFAAAAGLSTWAIDSAATQVGLPSMQAALGISVTESQWILNLTLMILAGMVTVGGALGDRVGRMRMFRLGILLVIAGAAITFAGGLINQLSSCSRAAHWKGWARRSSCPPRRRCCWMFSRRPNAAARRGA